VAIQILPEDDSRRLSVQAWVKEHPTPTAVELANAGFVCPHWPEPYGLNADPILQLTIDEELRAAGIRRPVNTVGTGIAGPTILHAGTAAQIEAFIPKILTAEEIWCQLFSEPNAGSDLASISTTAIKDGNDYIVNGQKVWTSFGHIAKFGVLLARTDTHTKTRQSGISYFICPMDLPGIEIRPLIEMTGQHSFNEVFFNDVRLPAHNLIGEENDGWNLAKITLANERVALSREGALWGRGPTAQNLIDIVKASKVTISSTLKKRTIDLHIESEILRILRLRILDAKLRGVQPGPEASVTKAIGDDHGQRVMNLAKDLSGANGMLTDIGPLETNVKLWHHGFLYSRALTIGGGTSQIQRTIIAERALGLPAEPRLL